MSRPHLLYIAYSFPPSTASSVYRCAAVANAFAADGWDVTVLTVDPTVWSEIAGLDQKLLESVDSRVRMVHVTDGGAEDPARGNLRAFSRLRIAAPYVWKELRSRRSRRKFPEKFHGSWLEPAGNAAKEVHAAKPVDLVMASANPYVSFAVAQVLEGIPFVMDYRDAWAFNTISGEEDFAPDSPTGKLEADYLAKAAQVWFVNDQIRSAYAQRYPGTVEKMRVVANGFDPQPGHTRPTPQATERPRFGYLGTLQYVNMPLKPFLDGWDSAFGSAGQRRAEAVFRGKLSPSGAAPADVLAAFGAANGNGLRYDGPISKRDVAGFYSTLDALILLLSTGKFVTGGKTAEYLATGLPIVSVHDLGNAATDLLRDYPLWFPARDLSPEGIAAAFKECADALEDPNDSRWQSAWDYGQQFDRTAILAPVIAELRDIIGRVDGTISTETGQGQ